MSQMFQFLGKDLGHGISLFHTSIMDADRLEPTTADIIEAAILEWTVADAIRAGRWKGPSYSAYQGDSECVGVFGFTEDTGLIWSFWSKLTMKQSQVLLSLSPLVLDAMIADAGRSLRNHVWEGNLSARKFLEASGRIVYTPEDGDYIDRAGRTHLAFKTVEPADV